MASTHLTAEELLAGAQAPHRVDVPAALLGTGAPRTLKLAARFDL